MAGQTVIDQLIVKLGLDPRDFEKGTKAAAASLIQTETAVKKSSDGMGRSITGLAAKWLTVTAAIAAVKKAVTVIDDVATKTRRLGIDAKNYGIAAAGLRNFENTVEMFGGSAEDARKSIAGMNKAVFDLAYNGQMSDGLVMLARLGVQFQTTTGEARDFKSIVLDTADAIGKAQAGGMSRQNAFQYLQQSGFDQGTAQMILAGRGAAEAGLSAQEKRRQVTDDDVNKATGINQAKIGRDQALEGAKIQGMEWAGSIQEGVNNFIERLASPGGASAAVGDLADSAKAASHSLSQATSAILAHARPKGRAAYESIIQKAAADNNIPAEILAGVLATESNFDPAALDYKTGGKLGRGIAQLSPKYYPDAGQNPYNDIRTAAGALSGYEKQADGNWDVALQMYNAGPGRVRQSMEPGGKPLTQEAIDYPGKVMNYATDPSPSAQTTSAGNQTDVQIDSITIQTRATDAQGIAEDMDGAVKRKLLASHSEQGMQ